MTNMDKMIKTLVESTKRNTFIMEQELLNIPSIALIKKNPKRTELIHLDNRHNVLID